MHKNVLNTLCGARDMSDKLNAALSPASFATMASLYRADDGGYYSAQRDEQEKSSKKNRDSTMGPEGDSITVYGWMHKQGTRVFKGDSDSNVNGTNEYSSLNDVSSLMKLGPGSKSWRRRFFCMEGHMVYYFHEPVDARKYFNSRKPELCIGSVNLRSAFKLEQSSRLDLPAKGIEIHTKRRKWLLCPESDAEFNMWFDALEEAIMVEGRGNIVMRQLPNVRTYIMKGRSSYRFCYILFLITSVIELVGIILWFPLGIEPCDLTMRQATCDYIMKRNVKPPACGPLPFNGLWTPPSWYTWQAGIDGVMCFREPTVAHWASYFLFYAAEFISIGLGMLYYLGMWKPVRRGAQYLCDFNPPFPREKVCMMWSVRVSVYVGLFLERKKISTNLVPCILVFCVQ